MAARRRRRRATTWQRLAVAGASTPSCVRVGARQLHRAGHHHHRPRQQPDHRVPPGRDAVRRTRPPCRRAPTSRWPSSRPTAATRCSQHAAQLAAAGHSVHLRSGPGPADVRRRRAARASSHRRRWVAVNDYEARMLVRAHRHDAGGAVALAPARRRRHARRAGLRRVAAGRRARIVPGVAGERGGRSDRLRRRVSRGACSTAWSAAGRCRAAPSWATGSAR